MRRILVATPLKSAIPPAYNRALIDLKSRATPELILDSIFISGTGVNFARNEIALYARNNHYDEILWWDVDLKPTTAQFDRLLAHDEDIVCAMYCRRDVQTNWHITALPGVQTRPDGLQQVFKCAIGFSKMKTSVFDRIAARFPDRACGRVEKHGDQPVYMHEFFPMELIGPNSTQGRLEAIRRYVIDENGSDIMAVKAALTTRHIEHSVLTGEDYCFCRLAIASGQSIFLDTQMIVAHTGEQDFPIPTEQLEAALKENWRKS